MEFHSQDKWIDWVDALANDDYLVIDDFLSEGLFELIKSFLLEHISKDDFAKAGIGALVKYKVTESIRGDFVYWLDKQRDLDMPELFMNIEHILSMFNRLCFLSLSGYEFHLAHYPKGSFYKRHLDQFQKRNNRIITIIIYLNEGWKEGDGGELQVYHQHKGAIFIKPIKNRCVIFRSDTLEHEVLLTHKSRYSLTGWLLHQPASLGYLLG